MKRLREKPGDELKKKPLWFEKLIEKENPKYWILEGKKAFNLYWKEKRKNTAIKY